MMKSRKHARIGRKSAVLVSALLVSVVLSFGVSRAALAQPAGPTADVTALAGDAAPSDVVVTTTAPSKAVAPALVTTSPDAGSSSALGNLSNEVMNVILPALVTLIGLFLAWILDKVRKKLHLNVSDAQISAWSTLAEKAANRGAEWARKKVKDAADGTKVRGPDVLEVAVNWAVEMGKSFKLPAMGRDALEGLIENHLFSKRDESA